MKKQNFLVICLSPAQQKTLLFDKYQPSEVNRAVQTYYDASGKGINSARVLGQLGVPVTNLTHLPSPKNYPLFFEKLSAERFKTLSTTYSNNKTPLRMCTTIIDKHSKTTTELVESSSSVTKKENNSFYKLFLKHVKKYQNILIIGSRPKGFADDLISKMVSTAKKLNITVMLDITGVDLLNSLSYRPDFIKPNISEFLSTFSLSKNASKMTIYRKITDIRKKYGCEIIITNSDKYVIYSKNSDIKMVPVTKIIPLNTTGCGDSFAAGFLFEYAKSSSIEKAIKQGIKCGIKNALLFRPGVIR